MRAFRISAFVIAALAFGGCASIAPTDEKALERAREAIRQADLDFALALRDRDLERFRGFIAEDARFYGARVNEGPERVAEAWGAFFDTTSHSTLAWAPDHVEVSGAGDLGYSYGTYEMAAPGDDGRLASRFGNYVSIWRRGEDGRWRAVIDIGTAPGTLEGPGPALGAGSATSH
jgi:ketosteroid isomerase-like protein